MTVFDSVTSNLIAAAPRLSGVAPDLVANQITDAYLRLSVARSLLESAVSPNDELLDELRSIGAAQEAIALATASSETRRSASYVAASVYRLLSEAFPSTEKNALSANAISIEIASTLLFFVADAFADAAEVASLIKAEENDRFFPLVELIRRLGRGEVHLSYSRPKILVDPHESASSLGATIGYWKCENTLLSLFESLRASKNESAAHDTFEDIASSMESSVAFTLPFGQQTATTLIAGPWHLAKLLSMAEPSIRQSSSAAIRAPQDVDKATWYQHISRIVRRRPMLWRNHLQALDEGLLDNGVSAVLAFPTGAGKSTISELKIIATVLRGRNVICLAPTLSLVDQLARAFRGATSAAQVIAQRDAIDDVFVAEGETPKIYVMTPESCLAALGIDYHGFGDVGLVMFDEAHLMHAEDNTPSRRSLDATLCFLTLSARFPSADLMLVSAMISNSTELASWLSSITGRRAISLDNPWKPTRQARGALVYAATEVNTLTEKLNDAFDDSETQGVPSRVQKEMKAVPHGFFSLRSTWESMRTRDYKLLPLLSEPVQLGTGGKRRENGRWWLTPNANKVAAQLAKAASRSRMKTLVFSHKVDWTVSIAKDINSNDPKHTALLPAELTLVERIVDELGTQTGMYIKLEGDEVVGDAIPHHGLLLADERRLHEKLYQRADGVPVLVATSTVTQGMNFPSEFVLITSDRRFDPETNSRTRVESHELLNAAGRAGRAGSHSNALVLVIPGEIIEHDGAYRVGKAWKPLQETFSSSDQCVEITDPLLPLLDSMDDNEEWSPLLSYLVRRLDSVTDSEIGPGLLRTSLSAHRKRAENQDAWMDRRIAHLMEAMETESAEPWARQSSLVSGLPLKDIQFVATHLDSAHDILQSVEEWSDWMLNLLAERPALAEESLRSGSRAALGGNHDELDQWSSSGSRFIEHLRVLLPPWLRGSTLQDIQRIGIDRGLAKKSDTMLTFARKFVLRVVPDLAYLFSLPGLIEGQRELLENFVPLPADHPLFDLGKCVELGVNSGAKVERLQSNPHLTRQVFRPVT